MERQEPENILEMNKIDICGPTELNEKTKVHQTILYRVIAKKQFLLKLSFLKENYTKTQRGFVKLSTLS